MLILSWNVAGLSTTVNRIHEAFPTAGSLGDYFRRHHADIVCLQEHKIPKEQLSGRSEPRQCSHVPGYESFWSCCVDASRKGLNGVVTYARCGTVRAADAFALGETELDRQGRCVATDHGTFWLWNVYAPASANGLEKKMKFLRALRKAMQEKRKASGKPQILVGDLNITHTALDLHWKNRSVHVQDILDEIARKGKDESFAQWKLDICNHWSTIAAVMETQEVVETKTTNSITKEQYQKYRLVVTLGNGKRVFLGKHQISSNYCHYGYGLSPEYYSDPETGEQVRCLEANVIRIEVLQELMSKIAGVTWDESILRSIASTHGTVPRGSPHRDWLTALLKEDDMVDVFRHFYPKAEARFTCWDQSTNRRYHNDGVRLDYTIIDRTLLPSVKLAPSLRCGGKANGEADFLSEKEALRAATADGRFQPVSFGGGGMSTGMSSEALESQFGSAHTGMVYTPPIFSDHIGVSLLFNDDSCTVKGCQDLQVDPNDQCTRKATPHRLQKTIASFFQVGNTAKSSKSINAAKGKVLPKRAKQSAPKKSSILYHFQKK